MTIPPSPKFAAALLRQRQEQRQGLTNVSKLIQFQSKAVSMASRSYAAAAGTYLLLLLLLAAAITQNSTQQQGQQGSRTITSASYLITAEAAALCCANFVFTSLYVTSLFVV
jgi:hypothetical protein